MGLFDNLFGGSQSSSSRALTPQEAFAGILIGASACDGHAAEEEIKSLFVITERMKLFDGLTSNKWNSMVDGLVKIMKKDGVEKLIAKCAEGLPDELRATAFANSCDMVLADGVVEDEEKAFLDNLQKVLEIDGDTALTIVEVMIIKNKG
jgi:tellurite resistance protein